MALTYFGYPKCGTCRKAKKWLEDHNISFEEAHIVDTPPSRELLAELYSKSDVELKKFFNTSGRKYRELGLKDKIKTASDDELLDILASDGMLIKRPIVTNGKQVTIGFNEERYQEMWS